MAKKLTGEGITINAVTLKQALAAAGTIAALIGGAYKLVRDDVHTYIDGHMLRLETRLVGKLDSSVVAITTKLDGAAAQRQAAFERRLIPDLEDIRAVADQPPPRVVVRTDTAQASADRENMRRIERYLYMLATQRNVPPPKLVAPNGSDERE